MGVPTSYPQGRCGGSGRAVAAERGGLSLQTGFSFLKVLLCGCRPPAAITSGLSERERDRGILTLPHLTLAVGGAGTAAAPRHDGDRVSAGCPAGAARPGPGPGNVRQAGETRFPTLSPELFHHEVKRQISFTKNKTDTIKKGKTSGNNS